MIRPLLTEIGIFLVPFAVYALFLLARREGIVAPEAWPVPVLIRLAVAAMVLVMVSLVLVTQFSGAPPGATYVPAHIENGKFVPGIEK